jgi:AraC-like DNA-binding protein
LVDFPPVKKSAVRAHAFLRPFIERIWSWESSRSIPLPTLVPGTGFDWFIHFASPFGIVWSGSVVPLPATHLTCLRSHSCQLAATGPVGFVAVRFRSSALRHFSDAAVPDLLDRCPDAREVFGAGVETLPLRLAALTSFGARAEAAADFLSARLARRGMVYGRSDRALDAVYYGAAGRRVADIADSLGYSRRQFERDVRAACGLAPKNYARICRLHHTARDVLLSGSRDYLDAALANGYYDQAHFAHEFRALAGMTAGDFFTAGAFASHFYNTKWPR